MPLDNLFDPSSTIFRNSQAHATMESQTSQTADKTPWGIVFLLVGAGIVVCFQIGKAPPVLPFIMDELDMSLFAAGWILSIFSIIGLILGSVIGAVSDFLGYRRILIRGLLLAALGSLLGALSPSGPILLATRIAEGFGFLMIAVSAPSLIVQVTRSVDLRLALSLWSCWLPAGAALMMLITPLCTMCFGWRGLWVVNSFILAGYAFWIRIGTRRLIRRSERRVFRIGILLRDIRATSTSPGPLLLAVTFSTYTLQWLGVMGFLPTVLIEDYGLGAAQASILTGLMVAINVPGNLAGGWLLQKGVRRWRIIATASLVMGLCSIAIYSSALTFAARYTACLLFSCIGGILPASILSGVPVYAPKEELVATTNGLVIQGSQLGNVVGPPALALTVSQFGGWHAAPLLLVSIAALGIALSILLGLMGRSRPR